MSSAIPARRQSGWVVWLLVVVLVVGVLFAGYTWTVLSWSYSQGERAGYVQKFSRKGWICKTWEGELAMVAIPGSLPEIFRFTAKDETVANQINAMMGRRVALTYQQHVGIPSSCFGETQYFIVRVQAVE